MKDFETLNLAKGKESKTIIRKEDGIDDDNFHEIMNAWNEFIDGQEIGTFEKAKKYEVNKSPEQEALLQLIFSDINGLLEKHGLGRVEFSSDTVKLVEKGFFSEVGISDENIDGNFNSTTQTVFIKNQELGLTNSEFSALTYHELLHLASFNRLKYSQEINEEVGAPIFEERGGISVVDRKAGKQI